MKKHLKKLLLGKNSKALQSKFNPIQKRILNIQSIWNNDHQNDNGIEKIVRLILASSQLLFPGIYIKYFTSKKGIAYQELASDFYIFFKVALPLMILINQWQNHQWLIWILIYLFLETLF